MCFSLESFHDGSDRAEGNILPCLVEVGVSFWRATSRKAPLKRRKGPQGYPASRTCH